MRFVCVFISSAYKKGGVGPQSVQHKSILEMGTTFPIILYMPAPVRLVGLQL